ncbi:MAG: glycosyltransferase family 2 protein [Patescibacteria group bacterium]|nr:glycosyltransferase family 2 protein [Patescibacteria group bacterium]
MKNSKPLISILLPVHNSEKYLLDCIQSLLSQTYKNIEVIAIDDFSSDKSYKILNQLKKTDNRLRVYKNVKRYGISVTLNRLVKRAKGSYIAFMDTNDISSPNRLKKQYKFLIQNPGIVAVGSQCTFINDHDKKIGKSDFPLYHDLIAQNPLHGISMQFETVLINKMILPKDVLKFNTNSKPFFYSDLFMKLLPFGMFANMDDFLHYHRNDPKIYLSDLKRNVISLAKLWIRSTSLYDFQPPVRTFFSSLIKTA